MNTFLVAGVSILLALFVSCSKNSPTNPAVASATPEDTRAFTITATHFITGTLTATPAITKTCSITETSGMTSTITETATITSTPTTTNSPTAAEYGSMTADRSLFLTGETGITVVMIYTAARDWNPSAGHGVLEIGLPPDFSPFSTNPFDAGYVTISCPERPVQNVAFCCGDNMRIYITVPDMNAGDTVTVTYGDKSGGGPGAVAAAYELTGNFECLVGMDGDYTDGIQNSPQCLVRYATATCTETLIASATPTWSATFTITESATRSATRTITDTGTPTFSRTVTETMTPTPTTTITPSFTSTPYNINFGGSGYDCFNSVCADASGNIFAAGYTNSYGAGNNDVLLVKYDANGNELWYRAYGTAGKQEVGNSIKAVSAGGFVIAGYVYDSTSGTFYLIRTDADGNPVWEKTYRNTTKTASHDIAYSVLEDSYGGFIVAGESDKGITFDDNSMYTIKTDASGNYVNYFSYDTSGIDMCRDVVQVTQYDFFFAGGSMNGASRDMMMIDASLQYNTWQDRWFYTASPASTDTAYSIIKTSSGGYLLAGSSSGDFYAVNAAANGSVIDSRTWGYSSEFEMFYSAAETADGYVCVGYSNVHGSDIYYVKYDKTLSNPYLWDDYIGGTGEDIGRCVISVTGGVIIAGSTYSYGDGSVNGYITKIDSNGVRVR
ncbi:MAG: hypothetical protein LLG37_10390 [Spirochaetia bacterium]|nr:hypothetical protein [Spirochaetia bacterium]